MPALNMRLAAPAVVVDINGLVELSAIERTATGVRIGALARHCDVAQSPVIAQHLPMLKQAVPHIAHAAIRNRGSFGGSLAHADPAAEWPACVLALDARMNIASLRGSRSVPAKEFFLGVYTTALMPDELLLSIDIPVPETSRVAAFEEIVRRKGDFALAGIALSARKEAGRLHDLRIACFGVADTAVLAAKTAQMCEGGVIDALLLQRAQDSLCDEVRTRGDAFCSAQARLQFLKVLLARSFAHLAS